jgi:hypothetical protein
MLTPSLLVSREEKGVAPASTHDGVVARQRLELCSGKGYGAGESCGEVGELRL